MKVFAIFLIELIVFLTLYNITDKSRAQDRRLSVEISPQTSLFRLGSMRRTARGDW